MPVSTAFKRFTVWCAVLTYALIVAGAVVRTTGSGEACPDWPLCYGQVIPPLQLSIWIEWTHRLITSLVYTSVFALVVWASLRYRAEKVIFRGAWLAFFLLIFQIVLGGLVVVLHVPPALVGVHLANALLIFATVLAVCLTAYRPWAALPQQGANHSAGVPAGGRSATAPSGATRLVAPAHATPPRTSGVAAGSVAGSALQDARLKRLIILSAAAVYILIFSGSVVTGTSSSSDCVGWPLCSDGILPAGIGQAINLTHRYFASAVGILLLYTMSETLRRYRANKLLRRAAHTAIGLFAVQIVIGGINVLTQFTPFWNALHLAAATAVWGAMFAYALIGMRVLGGSAKAAQPVPGVNPNAQPYPPTAAGR